MTYDGDQPTERQLADAQAALDISAINGIISLAITLRKRGVATAEDIESLHAYMVKPFDQPHNANNSILSHPRQEIDALLAIVRNKG